MNTATGKVMTGLEPRKRAMIRLAAKSAAGGSKRRKSPLFIPESQSITNASTVHRTVQAAAAPTIPNAIVKIQKNAINGRASTMVNLPVKSAFP